MRQYLKRLREDVGLSQQCLAERLSISQNYYSMIESGERQQKLDLKLAVRLAEIFGVTIDYIVQHEEESA